MKKNLLLFIMLCVAHTGFTQVEVNSTGNTGIGALPNSNAKLLLNNSLAATSEIFGLHSTVSNTNTGLFVPVYGIYSNNSNASSMPGSPLYGAYFQNRQTNPDSGAGTLYGVYLDNENVRYSNNSVYGVYANNVSDGYLNEVYGCYTNNTNTNYSGSLYGFYANNTCNTDFSGSSYGVYLNNERPHGPHGSVYGIRSTNTINTSQSGTVCGAYLSAISLTNKSTVYGIYSTVSGGYAGYFTGGKVEVNGDIWYSGSLLQSSDERLKSDIKSLSNEKDKLYLLQGKSYIKMLPPPLRLEEDSLAEKREIEIVKFPEYGYLAQELKEIFPDLVKQSRDSGGYYAVNYIGLIPIIVEALKDQKLIIENLQKEIQQKTAYPEAATINELQQRVELLEKALAACCSTEKLKSAEKNIQQFDLADMAGANDEEMILYQNAPNPFHENTTIQCYIPQHVGKIQLCVYDMQGIQVKCLLISERGTVTVQIQAGQLTAGIYTYLLIGDSKTSEAKQMILTK